LNWENTDRIQGKSVILCDGRQTSVRNSKDQVFLK